jgi:phosphoglycolate phosphatase
VARGVRAVLFDLDGTLLDTAPDLIAAVNRLRAQQGLPTIAAEQFRPFVSKGGSAMMAAAFPHLDEAARAPLLPIFLDLYRQHIARYTRLFPGFAETLTALQAGKIRLGIITNKPTWLVTPLLAALGLTERFGAVLCGDSLPEKKPHPAPILEACRRLAVAPEAAVMVGDDRRDIASARAAGSYALAAGFGYIASDDDPGEWGADAVIDHPAGILDWLCEHDDAARG